MNIIDFKRGHVDEAAALAFANYEDERGHVPALPLIDAVPDLTGFADNNLGVAAFDGGRLVGFMCGHGVWDNAWGISGLRNVFSPMHANGAQGDNRARAGIYARIYQAAGEKWARAGAASHGVCLHAHDAEAQGRLSMTVFVGTTASVGGVPSVVRVKNAGRTIGRPRAVVPTIIHVNINIV